jgi:hypothetical protein
MGIASFDRASKTESDKVYFDFRKNLLKKSPIFPLSPNSLWKFLRSLLSKAISPLCVCFYLKTGLVANALGDVCWFIKGGPLNSFFAVRKNLPPARISKFPIVGAKQRECVRAKENSFRLNFTIRRDWETEYRVLQAERKSKLVMGQFDRTTSGLKWLSTQTETRVFF